MAGARGQMLAGIGTGLSSAFGEIMKKIPFGKTTAAVTAGTAVTGAVGFGALQIDESLRGENSVLGRAKQNEASSNAAAGSQGWWAAIKEGFANFLEVLADIFPNLAPHVAGLQQKLRTNISRSEPESLIDAIGDAVGNDPGNLAIAAAGPTAGLGAAALAATRTKGQTSPLPQTPTDGGTLITTGSKQPGPNVTGVPGNTPPTTLNIADAMEDAMSDVDAMDAEGRKPSTPNNGAPHGNGGGNAKMSKWVKGGIGGLALTTVFGIGTRMAFAGEDIQEAAIDTITQDIPFVQAGIEAQNGNMEEAAYLATVDTAGAAGMVGGGALGVWGGAAAGAAIGSVIPIVGTAAGGVVGGIVGGLLGSTAGGMGGAVIGDAIYTSTFNSAAQNVPVNEQDWGQQYAQQQVALQNQIMANAYGTTPNTLNFNANAANGGQIAPVNPMAVYNPNVGDAGITGPQANSDYKMGLAM